MNKILGWPEPTEVGGHMVKRSNGDLDDRRAVFTCVDCGTQETGGVVIFEIGIDGCSQRPESLDYLRVSDFVGTAPATKARRASASASHWRQTAQRIALKVDDWEPVTGDPVICARFTFKGASYELRYNQPGPHGVHHIHAVKVEE